MTGICFKTYISRASYFATYAVNGEAAFAAAAPAAAILNAWSRLEVR